ncbi:putative membrane protein YqgA involved in biofilm formation [Dysgonomonadaceae bacterium PH5-43]|nr:putative membrane protein YqgA involved in biofilm formation [Dysgonomonadaceae bacterium PH5-43]
MLGTLINAGAVIVGSSLGLMLKKELPEKYNTIYFQAVGLFTLVLGVQMALKINLPLLVVFALIAGGLTGEFLKLETRMNNFGDYIKTKLKFGNSNFTEGMVTAFLLFCMGSMSIIGPVEEGLTGEISDLLKAKSLMDGFSSLLLTSALGVGVLFSVIPLLIYQGGITLVAQFIGKDISEVYINEITVVGGILLIGLAFNILEIKKLKILNMLPALIYICVFIWIYEFI